MHSRARSGRFQQSIRCAFHVIRSGLRAPATSSVHNPRCSRQYFIPIHHSWGSRADLGLKAAGKHPEPDAPNRRWLFFPSTPPRAGQPPACRRKHDAAAARGFHWHARANGFEHHGRRSPRHGRLARAARQRVCAHSLSTQSSRPAAPSALAARQLPGSRRRSGVRCPICTWWAIHAVAARRPRATSSLFGMNSGATQRAEELAATDPVNRSQLGRRLELAACCRPVKLQVGAAFEHGTRRWAVGSRCPASGAQNGSGRVQRSPHRE